MDRKNSKSQLVIIYLLQLRKDEGNFSAQLGRDSSRIGEPFNLASVISIDKDDCGFVSVLQQFL